MPGMGGSALADELHRASPEVRVLFMSGHTADIIADRGVLKRGVHFIQKPFTAKAHALRVQEVLRAPRRAPRPDTAADSGRTQGRTYRILVGVFPAYAGRPCRLVEDVVGRFDDIQGSCPSPGGPEEGLRQPRGRPQIAPARSTTCHR